jgi:hypothetical protein
MKGLTGKQGVINTYQNTGELMLRDDIIESVKKKGIFYLHYKDN